MNKTESFNKGEIHEGDKNVNVADFIKYVEMTFGDNPAMSNTIESISEILIDNEGQIMSYLLDERHKFDLLHAATGVSSEHGEILDHVRKFVFHGKPMDKLDLCIELGDMTFYYFAFLRLCGIPFWAVLDGEIAKLNHRHPKGMSKEYYKKKIKKDFAKEREVVAKAVGYDEKTEEFSKPS